MDQENRKILQELVFTIIVTPLILGGLIFSWAKGWLEWIDTLTDYLISVVPIEFGISLIILSISGVIYISLKIQETKIKPLQKTLWKRRKKKTS